MSAKALCCSTEPFIGTFMLGLKVVSLALITHRPYLYIQQLYKQSVSIQFKFTIAETKSWLIITVVFALL